MLRSLNAIQWRTFAILTLCLAGASGAGYLLLMSLWPASLSADELFTLERILYLGTAGFLLIAALVAVAAAQLRTLRAVREDIGSLSSMFRDVRKNELRESYPMQLAEFAGVFEYLRESGRKLVEEKRKLKGLGLIDHLSQLPNRRYFEKRLREAFETCKTHGPSSVLIIDVDHFKQVNDQHGHDIGDALIVAFAKALRESVRQTDFLARLGGDEFCVVYRYVPLNKASAFVERLRKQLPREVQLPKGIMHPLKWTGGLAAIEEGDKKFDDVLWRADKALLEAKTAGRNNTKVYHPEGTKPRLRVMM